MVSSDQPVPFLPHESALIDCQAGQAFIVESYSNIFSGEIIIHGSWNPNNGELYPPSPINSYSGVNSQQQWLLGFNLWVWEWCTVFSAGPENWNGTLEPGACCWVAKLGISIDREREIYNIYIYIYISYIYMCVCVLCMYIYIYIRIPIVVPVIRLG